MSTDSLHNCCHPSSIPDSVKGIRLVGELFCTTCTNADLNANVEWVKMEGDYQWCLSLRCCICNSGWFVCTACNFYRLSISKFTSTKQLARHHRLRHKVIEPQNPAIMPHDEAADTPDLHYDAESTSYDLIESALHPAFSSNVERSASTFVTSSYDMRKLFFSAKSTYYFNDELSHGETSGVKRLVMNSQFGCTSSLHDVSSTDVARELRMAKYIYKMKKDQRMCFP